jgi:hypothetical protein
MEYEEALKTYRVLAQKKLSHDQAFEIAFGECADGADGFPAEPCGSPWSDRRRRLTVFDPLCVGKIYVAMGSQLPAINASS